MSRRKSVLIAISCLDLLLQGTAAFVTSRSSHREDDCLLRLSSIQPLTIDGAWNEARTPQSQYSHHDQQQSAYGNYDYIDDNQWHPQQRPQNIDIQNDSFEYNGDARYYDHPYEEQIMQQEQELSSEHYDGQSWSENQAYGDYSNDNNKNNNGDFYPTQSEIYHHPDYNDGEFPQTDQQQYFEQNDYPQGTDYESAYTQQQDSDWQSQEDYSQLQDYQTQTLESRQLEEQDRGDLDESHGSWKESRNRESQHHDNKHENFRKEHNIRDYRPWDQLELRNYPRWPFSRRSPFDRLDDFFDDTFDMIFSSTFDPFSPFARRRRTRRRQSSFFSPFASMMMDISPFRGPLSPISSFEGVFEDDFRSMIQSSIPRRNNDDLRFQDRLLDQAERFLNGDIACQTAMGTPIRIGHVISRSSSSSTFIMNGRQTRQQQRILQVSVQGSRQGGVVQITATETGVQSMILHVTGDDGYPREINVRLTSNGGSVSSSSHVSSSPEIVDAEIVSEDTRPAALAESY